MKPFELWVWGLVLGLGCASEEDPSRAFHDLLAEAQGVDTGGKPLSQPRREHLLTMAIHEGKRALGASHPALCRALEALGNHYLIGHRPRMAAARFEACFKILRVAGDTYPGEALYFARRTLGALLATQDPLALRRWLVEAPELLARPEDRAVTVAYLVRTTLRSAEIAARIATKGL